MHQLVIVDDESIIVEGIKNSIDWNGFNINIALATTAPLFALDYILENEVDIVITDIAMPTLSGLNLIQKIKVAKPSTYVVVLSSFDNFEYTKTALRSGAENYLLKPLDKDELSDTISQIISHIQERDELKDYYGYSLLTFRSAFTEQWFKNLLSNNEFQSKAELLGINLVAKNYTVLIFSSTTKNATLMSNFLDGFLAEIIGVYSANFYFETPYRLLCVLFPTEHTHMRLTDFIERLTHMIHLQRFHIFISVGTTVDHFSKVPNSYNTANFLYAIEYTNASHYHYNFTPGFMKEVKHAIHNYVNIPEEHESFIASLFSSYPPYDCTTAILCETLFELNKNANDFSTNYPALVEQLKKMPNKLSESSVFLSYVLGFLESINGLILQTQQTTYPIVDSAIKMIHNFTDKDISLKTLSVKLNVTPSYLGSLFRQQTGCYFNDYLSESRLKYAAILLSDSDLKIKDIVEKIGFSSQTYFNRAFKRYFNTSPMSYRRNKSIEQLDNSMGGN